MPDLSFDHHSRNRLKITNNNWNFEAIIREKKLGVGTSTRSIAWKV